MTVLLPGVLLPGPVLEEVNPIEEPCVLIKVELGTVEGASVVLDSDTTDVGAEDSGAETDADADADVETVADTGADTEADADTVVGMSEAGAETVDNAPQPLSVTQVQTALTELRT